jgi:hypothetical protein
VTEWHIESFRSGSRIDEENKVLLLFRLSSPHLEIHHEYCSTSAFAMVGLMILSL